MSSHLTPILYHPRAVIGQHGTAASGGGEETHVPHDQFSSSAIPTRRPALFTVGPRVINLDLELFGTQLAVHSVPVVHVDWRPPAGGDTRLASLLVCLR